VSSKEKVLQYVKYALEDSFGAGLLILQYILYCNTIGNTFSSIASILAILFQKIIANGIANTFVPKILPILFGNTFILLDTMIIVKRFNNILSQLLKACVQILQ